MVKRRDIREAAMQLLFAHDLHGELREEDRTAFWSLHNARPELREAAEAMVRDIAAHLGEIDSTIAGSSDNYALDRINTVDRNILRLAVYELLHRHDVPIPAVINEAIEIARRFATEDSARFVNGLLDRIAKAKRSDHRSKTPNKKS